jgi:hypothetical protein
MEKLFTKDELMIIEKEANSNLDYYLDTSVLNGKATQTSIITISKKNNLIFVEGNLDTGFKHLSDRHSFLSFKNYWITNEEDNLKLDNPSKFNPRMMPILDYVKIADTIFCEENKNITKNNKSELFDKFSGQFNYDDMEKYHLITYKNTKIVHTLFPDKKKHNSKRKCKFGKGTSKITLKLPEGYNDLFMPYENSEGKIAYSILFRKFYLEKIERVYIQKHDDDENPIEQHLLLFRNFEDYEKFEREDMNWMQIADLSDFEKIINEIDEHSS